MEKIVKDSPNITGFTEEATDGILEKFKKEVHDLSGEIDPDSEHDWYSLAVGWAIGIGYNPEQAELIGGYIRYCTNLG